MPGEAQRSPLYLPLAREARTEFALATLGLLGAAMLLAVVPSWAAGGLLAVLAGLWLLVSFFSRDPRREPASTPGVYLSPADGKVMALEAVHEPHFLGGPALRVAVFMSFLDVHVNRSPSEGTVRLIRHTPGEFLQAFRPEAAERNENNLIGLEHGPLRILVKQVAGILARRIVCSVQAGEHLQAGQRLGMIKLGSRVEVFLPAGSRPLVQVGDRVRAGLTPLAERVGPPSAGSNA
jgi:phosphatidylserine decarboxylase